MHISFGQIRHVQVCVMISFVLLPVPRIPYPWSMIGCPVAPFLPPLQIEFDFASQSHVSQLKLKCGIEMYKYVDCFGMLLVCAIRLSVCFWSAKKQDMQIIPSLGTGSVCVCVCACESHGINCVICSNIIFYLFFI